MQVVVGERRRLPRSVREAVGAFGYNQVTARIVEEVLDEISTERGALASSHTAKHVVASRSSSPLLRRFDAPPLAVCGSPVRW